MATTASVMRGLGLKPKPNWKNRCTCPCGCNRRTALGPSPCSYCERGAHSLPIAIAAYVERRIGRQEDRGRTKCTVCGRSFNWSELQPGTGRCVDDQA